MKKTLISVLLSTSVVAFAQPTFAADGSETGPFGFEPIDASASAASGEVTAEAPWKLPEGFEQHNVRNEEDLNIYDEGRDDWHDMNTVNEAGKFAGRFLYTTHEVRGEPEGGAVSVLDQRTGEAKILAQDPSWTAIDGIVWTPWGTLLTAEETTNGRFFEIVLDKQDPTKAAAVYDRPAVGRLAHEGIEVGADGSIYVVDEFRGQREGYGGGIYRFVPDVYGDLSSGELYVLSVDGEDGTGQGEWVGPIDPATARTAGTEAGGTGYNRPEDLQIIGDTLYVAVTEGIYADGSQTFDGRVLAVDLKSLQVTNFIKPGVNVAVEEAKPGDEGFQTGFDNPDNLAATADGKLVIVEDNVPSDIWIAEKDSDNDGVADSVNLFASLKDYSAEGTGIYFGKHPRVMYVNVQHSQNEDGDGTWMIYKK